MLLNPFGRSRPAEINDMRYQVIYMTRFARQTSAACKCHPIGKPLIDLVDNDAGEAWP
jgi:hypothetical protein